VPGGTFNRANDPAFPATVGPFKLDRFEVTVGRFRTFVEAYPGSKPAVGAGKHPMIDGTGWDPAWDSFLPPDEDALRKSLTCEDNEADFDRDPASVTWTQTTGADEKAPVSCVSWVLGFAFCAWDGGRLPTEAELLFAAQGGDEQRSYPWGSAPADETRAVLNFIPDGAHRPVGSVPAGAGKWGHLDLNGSRFEFVFDAVQQTDAVYPMPCIDCAATQFPPNRMGRLARDLSFYQKDVPPSTYRLVVSWSRHTPAQGIRCARD
jgi:formylglycine-generating enzyme required for sulfatase activity